MTAKMKMTLVWIALFTLIAIALTMASNGTLNSLFGWDFQLAGHCVGSFCSTL